MNLFTIAPAAADWLKEKLGDAPRVQVAMTKKGCAGGAYEFTRLTADADTSTLDKVEQHGVAVYFDRRLSLSFIGAELVLAMDGFNTRLDFKNPNEQGRCGCGTSVKL